jgi:Thiol-disulfide isomerase and thioredoxins
MKKTISIVLTVLLTVSVILFIVVPDTRAWVGRGLMKIGFFKPDLEERPEESPEQLAGASETTHLPVIIEDGQGNRIDAANQSGKVVFINFWATWCPPCIAEMPSIKKLYQQFKDNEAVVFLLVDVDGQYERSRQFMEDRKLGLPVHIPAGQIPAQWLGNAVPTTVILDKQGQVAARHEGMADYSRPEIAAFINRLASE